VIFLPFSVLPKNDSTLKKHRTRHRGSGSECRQGAQASANQVAARFEFLRIASTHP